MYYYWCFTERPPWIYRPAGGVDAPSVEVSVRVPDVGVSPSGDASSGGEVKVAVPGDGPKIEGEVSFVFCLTTDKLQLYLGFCLVHY